MGAAIRDRSGAEEGPEARLPLAASSNCVWSREMSEHHRRLEVEEDGGAAPPWTGCSRRAAERRSLRAAGRPQKWRGRGNSHFSQRLRAGWLRKVQVVQLH